MGGAEAAQGGRGFIFENFQTRGSCVNYRIAINNSHPNQRALCKI
jgi:hypothetical protein